MPNSEEAPPTSILVMFTCVYITPPYQNYPHYFPPSLLAPTASKIPYPALINTIYYPSNSSSHRACDLNLGGGQNPVWIHQPYGLYPVFDIRI